MVCVFQTFRSSDLIVNLALLNPGIQVPAVPNKPPEPTTMAVTSRAPSSTSRASHGRGKITMTLMGIGWYRKEQWDHLRRISIDQHTLEHTWEEWVENAERRMVQLIKDGHQVQKVPVDVAELELWCRSKNKPCDGEARAEYITRHIR
jgi:hypothetical protein